MEGWEGRESGGEGTGREGSVVESKKILKIYPVSRIFEELSESSDNRLLGHISSRLFALW